MTLVRTLVQGTARAKRRLMAYARRRASLQSARDTLVPIYPLTAAHLPALREHLLSLDERDRYLRFGYQASDAQIDRYLQTLDFDRDEVYGIFNRRLHMVAMAHLALIEAPGREACAEFGVSVLAHARGRGYGARLFERAVTHARNAEVSLMYIHALSENAPMIRIARKAGAEIERDGSETEAYLRLPRRDLDSRVSELLADQFAKANYTAKEDAHRFWSFLERVKEIRQGVREGRHKSAE